MDSITVELPVWLSVFFIAEPLIPATWEEPAEGGYIEIHDIKGVGFTLNNNQKDHILERYEKYFIEEILAEYDA